MRRPQSGRGSIAAVEEPRIRAVDLFCGAGGLTHGLEKAGIEVCLGVDVDPDCQYPYEANNAARFLKADVRTLTGALVSHQLAGADLTLLAGCAPCQPFSTYSQGRNPKSSSDWGMLLEFGRLIAEAQPDLVTMENVPQLEDNEVFQDFLGHLDGYNTWCGVVDCTEYGIPQQRRRLVLLASRLGPVSLLAPRSFGARRRSVRSAIGAMPPLAAGTADLNDPVHVAAGMSDLNLKRIRASRPGGSWRDWPKALRAKCHHRDSGASYGAVYGRMEWNRPAPTMTTLCHGFGNGRFGHPEQDRAISLREAALLQSFPRTYRFVPKGQRVRITAIGRLIGNAVPPRLGEVIGRSLKAHVLQTVVGCTQPATPGRR